MISYGKSPPRIRTLLTAYRRVAGHMVKAVAAYPFTSHGREAIRKLAHAVSSNYEIAPLAIPTRNLFEILPAANDAVVEVPMGKGGRFRNVSVTERCFLAVLAKTLQPRGIFEFGTYDGLTTWTFAKAAPSAKITTIDLEPSIKFLDEAGAPTLKIGCMFHGTQEAQRIAQLFGDTVKFDFTPFESSMDFVFIDAKHTYENVKADTLNTERMLKKQGVRCIVWHDVTTAEGVRRFLEERQRDGHKIFHVGMTTMAVELLGP